MAGINGIVGVIVVIITVLIPVIVPMLLQFLRHWRESDALWQIGKRIDESSLLSVVVVEGAAFSKLALTGLTPVFARDCLVVRVHRSERNKAEIIWQHIGGVAQLVHAVSKLAVVAERALAFIAEVTALFGLVLVLKNPEVLLGPAEIFLRALLG